MTRTVFVVDDDAELRASLRRLIESVGLPVETYATAQEFAAAYDRARPGCLLLDVRMPGMSGLDLQRRLARDGIELPVVFITGHGDIAMAVDAMRQGALDFIEKPFRAQALLERVTQALELDAQRRSERQTRGEADARLSRLTRREREVLELLVAGQSVKQIATQLNISPKTAQIHRANLLSKAQVTSVVELARLALTRAGEPGEPRATLAGDAYAATAIEAHAAALVSAVE